MSLLQDLQVLELTAEEVRTRVSEYSGQPTSPPLDPWTKEMLALNLLKKVPEDTRFFLLRWYGYAVPMDAQVGEMLINNTSDGYMAGRPVGAVGWQQLPKCIGGYVRLEGRGFEGSDHHLMLIFLNPQLGFGWLTS